MAMLLLAVAPAHAADPWSDDDKARQAVYFVLHALDWAQTRWIARHPETYHETNPLLGEHPSVHEVDRYFALTAPLVLAVAHYLPSRLRARFQYAAITLQVVTVGRNHRIGIRLDF